MSNYVGIIVIDDRTRIVCSVPTRKKALERANSYKEKMTKYGINTTLWKVSYASTKDLNNQ